MIHTDCHTFDPIFSPPYISPKPLFLSKIVTQSHSVTLSKCPEFWKFFTQRPLIDWNLRKRYPNEAYFVMAFVTERPPIFCLAYTCLFEGNVASNTVRSWKILYSRNRIEQCGEYFQVQI